MSSKCPKLSVEFSDNFLLLPKNHQEIWCVLHWYVKTYRNAFPSQQKIAYLAKCSLRTVSTAIRNFKNFGWIEILRRAYHSNVYFIHKDILKINPKDQRNYLKEEPDKGPTPPNSRESCAIGCVLSGVSDKESIFNQRSTVNQIRFKQHGQWFTIRHDVRDLPFSMPDKVIIQRKYGEAAVAMAKESFNNYSKPKGSPIKLFMFLARTASEKIKRNL